MEEESRSPCLPGREEAAARRASSLPEGAAWPRLDRRSGCQGWGRGGGGGGPGAGAVPLTNFRVVFSGRRRAFSPGAGSRRRRTQCGTGRWGRALAFAGQQAATAPCPGSAATCRGWRPLPLRAKLCRLSARRTGRTRLNFCSASSPRNAAGQRGEGETRLGAAPRPWPRPRLYPRPPEGWRSWGVERAGDEPGPTPANQRDRPAHTLALTPFRPCQDLSDWPLTGRLRLHSGAWVAGSFGWNALSEAICLSLNCRAFASDS